MKNRRFPDRLFTAGLRCLLIVMVVNLASVLCAAGADIAELKARAEQGDADAQHNLGFVYRDGDGVPKDSVEAVKWWRKAAEQGNADAQLNLGFMYAKGDGVAKDNVLACMWLNLASSKFHGMSEKMIRLLETKMTPEQIAEAQRLSAQFVPQKAGAEASSLKHP
jgi:TPR repeat protein